MSLRYSSTYHYCVGYYFITLNLKFYNCVQIFLSFHLHTKILQNLNNIAKIFLIAS